MKVNIRKIMCPIDFSENSEHAMHYGIALAAAHEAELHLLHVTEPPIYPLSTDYFGPQFDSIEIIKDLEAISRKRMQESIETAKEDYATVIGKVVAGTPFVEIIRVAREDRADLIVLGTHGRTGLAHVMIGSVAEKVVRKAPCPVLTVKHPEHEFIMP